MSYAWRGLHLDREHVSFQGLACRWAAGYGLHIYLEAADSQSDKALRRYNLASHKLAVDGPTFERYPEARMSTLRFLDNLLTDCLPGVQRLNRMAICSLPKCERAKGKEYAICEPLGKRKWVCLDCVEEARRVEDDKRRQRAIATPKLRLQVLTRDGYTCKLCGRCPETHNVALRVDHIIAVALGGKTVLDNLQTLCDECNAGKGKSDPTSLLAHGRQASDGGAAESEITEDCTVVFRARQD